jgi:DNA-directed RNA polymerase specialized sigma24 family protein
VAEILDIPLGTARSRLRAAREAFRRSARRHQLVAPVVELAREGRS